MEQYMVFANVIATFGLGMLVAAVVARSTQARRDLETARAEIPTEEQIAEYLVRVVKHELPNCLHKTFEERMVRLQELRDEVRRGVKREAREAIERSEFHQMLEEMIEAKLTRGVFAAQVKASIDEHYKSLTKFLEDDAVPRAIEAKLAHV